jgi:glycosyltransferase involved in cell wall biosynthesis
MIIGIDGNEANQTIRVGVGQYAYNILTRLSQIKSSNIYHIYLKNPPLSDLPKSSPNWQYHFFGPQKLWTKLALPFHLYFDRLKLDLFYSPSHYSPSFCPFPTIPTIHDLGYLDTPHQFTSKDFYQLKNWTQTSIRKAKHLTAVSQFTKSQIQKIYQIKPETITVIPNGVGEPLKISPDQEKIILNKFNLSGQKYFIYLGTLKPNKNIPFLVEAFSQFIKVKPDYSNFKLVIAGKKGWLFRQIFSTVLQHKLTKHVIFTNYIKDTEKWTLLSHAQSLIIPSTYEGFGIPSLEAMKVKTPVIASNIPAFKEVAQSAAIFVDPFNQKSLTQAMEDILKPSTKQILIKNGLVQVQKYTWFKSAQLLSDFFSNFSI